MSSPKHVVKTRGVPVVLTLDPYANLNPNVEMMPNKVQLTLEEREYITARFFTLRANLFGEDAMWQLTNSVLSENLFLMVAIGLPNKPDAVYNVQRGKYTWHYILQPLDTVDDDANIEIDMCVHHIDKLRVVPLLVDISTMDEQWLTDEWLRSSENELARLRLFERGGVPNPAVFDANNVVYRRLGSGYVLRVAVDKPLKRIGQVIRHTANTALNKVASGMEFVGAIRKGDGRD